MQLFEKALKFLPLRKIGRGEVPSAPSYLPELTDPARWPGAPSSYDHRHDSLKSPHFDAPHDHPHISAVPVPPWPSTEPPPYGLSNPRLLLEVDGGQGGLAIVG
jgi:hypothetical protein